MSASCSRSNTVRPIENWNHPAWYGRQHRDANWFGWLSLFQSCFRVSAVPYAEIAYTCSSLSRLANHSVIGLWQLFVRPVSDWALGLCHLERAECRCYRRVLPTCAVQILTVIVQASVILARHMRRTLQRRHHDTYWSKHLAPPLVSVFESANPNRHYSWDLQVARCFESISSKHFTSTVSQVEVIVSSHGSVQIGCVFCHVWEQPHLPLIVLLCIGISIGWTSLLNPISVLDYTGSAHLLTVSS
jgi:hypothetical protein